MLAKYLLLAITAVGSFVSAQSGVKCADQVGFDKCIEITTATTKTCVGTGYEYYKCLCDAHKTVLGCYDRCPTLPQKSTQENTVTSFCQAAEQYRPTTTSTPVAAPTTTKPPSGQTTSEVEFGIQTSTPTATPTGGNGTDPSGENGAAGLSPLASLGFVAAGAVIAGFF